MTKKPTSPKQRGPKEKGLKEKEPKIQLQAKHTRQQKTPATDSLLHAKSSAPEESDSRAKDLTSHSEIDDKTLVLPLDRTPRPKNSTTQQFSLNDVVDDRYILSRKLGSGGMSEVFKAYDLQDNNSAVAIKLIAESFAHHPHAFSALIREAQKTMKLQHRNILRVFSYGIKDHYVYLVMELMKGEPLSESLKKDLTQFTLKQRLDVLRQIMAGLSYAHKKGIIHSDLKPGNLFLTKDDTVKIFDFGIARVINKSQTTREELKDKLHQNKELEDKSDQTFDISKLKAYTLAYASPEMLRFEKACVSDDVYSLGVIACELLFCQHPFKGQDALTAIEQNLKAQLTLKQFPKLGPVVDKAISLKRTSRFKNVDEFYEAINLAVAQ